MEKRDIEKDLKALKIHEPSSDFAFRVTKQAVQQLESKPVFNPWMKWIPRFCTAGFAAVFLVFLVLIVRYFSVEMVHPKVLFSLQAIGFCGMGYFLFLLTDRLLRQMIVR